MKIIGGTLKGRNFFMPKGIRPTQNVTRKAIFDILGHDLRGQSFLELFAGGGAVGLEAHSRGADRVVLVEKDARCGRIIHENLNLFHLNKLEQQDQSIDLIQSDAFATVKQLARQKQRFDIVFLDPPYGSGLAKKALKTLLAYDILHPDSWVIIEHSKREILPETEGRFYIIKQRKYGSTYLTVYQDQRQEAKK